MTDERNGSNPGEISRLAAFHCRDFRLFWISLFVSNTGTWMQMIATNWLL
jgi:Transmembrane secretion effector